MRDARDPLGVILANTGTPASPDPDDVEAYLRQFLMDERIRQLPLPLWRFLVFKRILPTRKHSSSKRYQAIWTDEGSPLLVQMNGLAARVQALFDEQPDSPVRIAVGMSYGSPSIETALEQLRQEGCTRIMLLPLYPQSAYSPTYAVIDAYERATSACPWMRDSIVVKDYHDNRLYIEAIAQSIRDAGFDRASDDLILMSMHAIPLKDVKDGDTYLDQTSRTAELVAKELGVDDSRITVGFQSVFGRNQNAWSGPLSRDILQAWSIVCQQKVFFVCPGFAVDCLETLYDIPFEMCPALEGEGATLDGAERFRWVPSLGTSDAHARIIKDVIESAWKD